MKSENINIDALRCALPQSFAPQEENETQRVLRAALSKFGPNGEYWCRQAGSGSEDSNYKYCTVLATKGNISANYALLRAFGGPQHTLVAIYAWNDAPDRTFADVRALYEKAIALAATQS